MEASLRNYSRTLIAVAIAAAASAGCQKSPHIQTPGVVTMGGNLPHASSVQQSAAAPIGSDLGTCGALNDVTAQVTTAEECAQLGKTFLPGVQPYQNMFIVSA